MYSEQNSKIFFNSYLDDKICSFCTQFPLCMLSYKEMAIIRLFQIKISEKIIYLSSNDIYAEFLMFYRIEKDGYEVFNTTLNNLVNSKGLLIKFSINPVDGTVSSFSNEFSKDHKQTRFKKPLIPPIIYYSLNPAFYFDSIDLTTISRLCPIGYDNLSYQILELLNHLKKGSKDINSLKYQNNIYLDIKLKKVSINNQDLKDGFTLREIIYHLKHDMKIIRTTRQIRRTLKKLLSSGIIFAQRSNDVTKPIKYSFNYGCFYPIKITIK